MSAAIEFHDPGPVSLCRDPYTPSPCSLSLLEDRPGSVEIRLGEPVSVSIHLPEGDLETGARGLSRLCSKKLCRGVVPSFRIVPESFPERSDNDLDVSFRRSPPYRGTTTIDDRGT